MPTTRKYAGFEDFYLLKNTDHTSGTPRFLYPSGSGDIRRLIPALKCYCRELNIPLLMTANAECTAVLKSLYPDVSAVADRDGSTMFTILLILLS